MPRAAFSLGQKRPFFCATTISQALNIVGIRRPMASSTLAPPFSWYCLPDACTPSRDRIPQPHHGAAPRPSNIFSQLILFITARGFSSIVASSSSSKEGPPPLPTYVAQRLNIRSKEESLTEGVVEPHGHRMVIIWGLSRPITAIELASFLLRLRSAHYQHIKDVGDSAEVLALTATRRVLAAGANWNYSRFNHHA